jgi:hypothetical protein
VKTWGSGGIAPLFLTSAPDGDEWSAPLHCRFFSWETAPCIHWIGGWAGLRAGLDLMEKRKIACPYWESFSIDVGFIRGGNWHLLIFQFGARMQGNVEHQIVSYVV